jgi:hypothetical protein
MISKIKKINKMDISSELRTNAPMQENCFIRFHQIFRNSLFSLLCILFSITGFAQVLEFDADKPAITYNAEYFQSFSDSWDGAKFYKQWEAKEANIFTAADIANGYLQFEWIKKRILMSKTPYVSPYVFQVETSYGDGSNRGGVVIRANPAQIDQVQEPAGGDPGFNREGIAFYPTDDGTKMIVQFSGTYNGDATTATRIEVAKPVGVASLKGKGTIRIEDFDNSIYVYYNDAPFIRINFDAKNANLYNSGSVYDANMQLAGTFSKMEVEVSGKVAIAQRDATLRLFEATIKFNELESQTITFNPIPAKLVSAAPFELDATSTSGLPVEFRIVSGPATVDGNIVTLAGTPGYVVVEAYQLGNSAYYSAPTVKRSFFIEQANMNTETEQLKAYGDKWVATDGIGRILPGYDDCGDYRKEKYVGMFYWLWHASIRVKNGPIKTSAQLMHENPESPAFECNDWYWGEPENGFYHPDDPWVTRRNLQMLANAGIDFIFFDFTNGDQGDLSLEKFMAVAMDMYNKGIPVPKISFFMNESYNTSMPSILNRIYNHPEYDPLLFKWEGKPLLMADSTKCATQCDLCNDKAIKDHFTWRRTWAFEPNQWNFIDQFPQDYFSKNGVPEQMPVSKSMGAPVNDWEVKGASFHDGKTPELDEFWETELSKYGYFFDEQWSQAFLIDPSIVCVTGWNELVAGAWPTHPPSDANSFLGKAWNHPDWRCVNPASCIYRNPDGSHNPDHGWAFIDEFNSEFNRDIEPMKGGYTDNYYYQLVSKVRKYKGMSAPEPFSEPKTITIDGTFTEWGNVTPVFKDVAGDVAHRNFKNVNNSEILVNNTGRNDIVELRSTYDAVNIYFYAKTTAALTPSTDPNWMLLFIDSDRNKGTGWEGYDYVINSNPKSATETTLKQWDGKNWINETVIPFSVNGTQLEISVPRTALSLDGGIPEFYFHWADNLQKLNDITAFFTDGESAPDRRFNYNFSTTKVLAKEQTPFKMHTIPGIIEFEDFDNGGVGVAYADADIANHGGLYRPDESVDIAGNETDGYFVGWVNNNEWLEYTVDVQAIGVFAASFNYASMAENSKIVLSMNGTSKTDTIVLPSTGGSDKWATKTVDLQLTAGRYLMQILIANAADGLQLDKMEFAEKEVVYPGTGTGLSKSLWTATVGGRNWFVDSICGEIDPIIDEVWEDVSPGCGIAKDFWNARWVGQIEPLFTDTFTFYLTVNDMGKLWVNGKLLIDGWVSTATGKTLSGKIPLVAGEKVDIRIDFADKAGDAFVKLEWESTRNLREVIPTSQLYPLLSTGINSFQNGDKQINVFPNPSNGEFTIDAGSASVQSFKLVDLQGRTVFSDNEGFTGSKKIKTNSIQPGVYFLQLNGKDFKQVEKIVLK